MRIGASNNVLAEELIAYMPDCQTQFSVSCVGSGNNGARVGALSKRTLTACSAEK
jgi:hypothetical protein